MSLRLEMLQVARLAPAVLGPEATALIEAFVRSQQSPEGGFSDRDGNCDLYYTSFGIDALTALQVELPLPSLADYLLEKSKHLDTLDFVHLCCLARSLSAAPHLKSETSAALATLFARLEGEFRTQDGGYTQTESNASGDDAQSGSAYACFLAYGAYADHGMEVPEQNGLLACLNSLADPQGAWVNDRNFPVINVPATAAAISLLRNLRHPIPPNSGPWLLQSIHPQAGGFLPFPGAPIPDLLSTAVALHALDGLQIDFSRHKDACLDFIDSLWTADGGFHGTWDDDDLDIEYTYYGLLALGHLSI